MRDDRIEYLIRLVEKSAIAELEISEGWGKKIRIRKNTSPTAAPTAPTPEVVPGVDSEGSFEVSVDAESSDANLIAVVAPMVGTFYRSPTPETSPFVEVGSMIKVGETLCIIEAMKIMNEIPSDIHGSIRKVLVENGQPVEFGEELFLIEKSD